MTGISYKATIDDADMREKLELLIDRMENAEGFYKNVGEHLLNSVSDNFENEESPEGEKWRALSAVTVDRRAAAGVGPTPILRVTGDLAGSFNAAATDHDVRIGTPKVQAALLHFGGESKGYMKTTIHPRPILGIGKDDEEEIFAIAEDWLSVE